MPELFELANELKDVEYLGNLSDNDIWENYKIVF